MKKALRIVLALALVLGLCACDGDQTTVQSDADTEGTDSVSEESFTIRMLNDGAGVWEPVMDQSVARWNELHPEAQLIMEYNAYGTTYEVIEMNLGMGSTDYDIIAVDTPKIAEYSEKGYIIPLDEYFSEEEVDQLQKPCIDASMYRDSLMVMPMDTGISV